jgi:hypothetical protein
MTTNRRLTIDVHRARHAVTAAVRFGTWKPAEVQQQRLLAELALLPGPLRADVLAALFGLGRLQCDLGPQGQRGRCDTCATAFTITRMRTLADLRLTCPNPACPAFGEPAVLVEAKPRLAPAAWSTSVRDQWVHALSTGVVRVLPGAHVELPSASCPRYAACPPNHDHPRHAKTDGPAIPQIVPAAAVAPVVVLAERAVDASTLYGTGVWGFEIDSNRVVVQQIARGLEAVLDVLNPAMRTLTRDSFDVLRYAIGGQWVRTGWRSSWPSLDAQPGLMRLLPASIAELAAAEVTRERNSRDEA